MARRRSKRPSPPTNDPVATEAKASTAPAEPVAKDSLQRVTPRHWFSVHTKEGQFAIGGKIGLIVGALALIGSVGSGIGYLVGPFHGPPRHEQASSASCIGDSAQIKLVELLAERRITLEQFNQAAQCQIRRAPEVPEHDKAALGEAARSLFTPVRAAHLLRVLDGAGRAEAATSLASDASLNKFADLNSLGLFLYPFDTNAAIQAYERARILEPNDPEVLNRLGQLYARQDNLLAARAVLEHLVETQPGDTKWQAVALNNLANAYANHGDVEQAKGYYLKAEKLNEAAGNMIGVARQEANLAQIEFDQFRASHDQKLLESAKARTQRSLDIFEGANQPQDMAESIALMAGIEHELGDSKTGLQHAMQATRMYADLKDSEGVATSRTVTAQFYLDARKWDAAAREFQAMRDEAEKQGMTNEVAIAWAGLAEVESGKGKRTAACTLYDQAFTVWKTMGINANHDDVEEARKGQKAAGCV